MNWIQFNKAIYSSPIGSVGRSFLIWLFHIKAIPARLFDLTFNPDIGPGFVWGLSTLLFKKVLDKYVKPGMDVLEVGCGLYGILSIYVAKKDICSVSAIDILPRNVEGTRRNSEYNHVQFPVVQSNMFQNLQGKSFDIIWFNTPYIPEDWLKKAGVPKVKETDEVKGRRTFYADGGEEGIETIRQFLNESKHFLNEGGRVLCGWNSFYVSQKQVKELVKEAQLVIDRIERAKAHTNIIYVLSAS